MTIVCVFVLGIFAAGTLNNPLFTLELAGIATLAILTLLILKKTSLIALFVVFVLAMGFYLLAGFFARQTIPVGCNEAKIASNPKIRGASQEFLTQDRLGRNAIISTTKIDNFAYGDQVKLCFDSKSVVSLDIKNSRYFLAQYKTAFELKNPQIEIIKPGRGAIRALYILANNISQKILYLYPGDAGVLAKGLLLGGSQGFSSNFQNEIKNSGTSHLVAVSGYNVSIITIVLFKFIRVAWSKRAAIILAIIFLIAFCLATGATASVLRASLMGMMYILAKIIGRRGAIINSLFVAAFMMLIFNPYSLWDIGFELSFMATFGLIFLGEPLIKIFFGRLAEGLGKNFVSTLCETLSAQLFTLPILLGAFGKVSIIAPLTNVLILVFVPISMLLIFTSVIGAFIFLSLGLFIAGISKVLLDYFMLVIGFFGSLKIAAIQLNIASWGWPVILYILVFALAIYLRRKSVYLLKQDPQKVKLQISN